MVKWIKNLLRIVESYDVNRANDIRRQEANFKTVCNQVAQAKEYIRERTDVSADVHFNQYARNYIIVTGRYRNRDYVEVFSLDESGFEGTINQLREMQRYARVRHIDAPPTMKAFIDHNF